MLIFFAYSKDKLFEKAIIPALEAVNFTWPKLTVCPTIEVILIILPYFLTFF